MPVEKAVVINVNSNRAKGTTRKKNIMAAAARRGGRRARGELGQSWAWGVRQEFPAKFLASVFRFRMTMTRVYSLVDAWLAVVRGRPLSKSHWLAGTLHPSLHLRRSNRIQDE